jgi:hypothetical protein
VSVPEQPSHGLPYKLTVAPVVAVWRGLVRVDTDWSKQRRTAPFPLFRWAAAIGILAWTATGNPPSSISGWFTAHLPWLIVAGVLTLAPEVVHIEFGGLKLELLRETREELRGLSNQVNQLQIQQAAANANATAGITQVFPVLEAAAGVRAATKQGEETKAVPAEEVDWSAFIRGAGRLAAESPGGTGPSTDSDPGSTVES